MSKKDIIKKKRGEVIKEAIIENDQTTNQRKNFSFFIMFILLCLFIGILFVVH